MTIPIDSAFFDHFTPRFEFVSSIEFHICDFVLPMYVEDFLDYPLFERYQFPLQVVWSRSTILNCIGRHFLCRLLEFLILISLMLTCFAEYFSVCCNLLLLKLFFSLCLLLYLIGYPDIYIFSKLFIHFFSWHIIVFVFFTCRFFLLSCAGTDSFLDFFCSMLCIHCYPASTICKLCMLCLLLAQ